MLQMKQPMLVGLVKPVDAIPIRKVMELVPFAARRMVRFFRIPS
jgi:hypothetical protein